MRARTRIAIALQSSDISPHLGNCGVNITNITHINYCRIATRQNGLCFVLVQLFKILSPSKVI